MGEVYITGEVTSNAVVTRENIKYTSKIKRRSPSDYKTSPK